MKITGMMNINVTGDDYRYNVHQCHRWRLQVWSTSMSPVKITGMMCINVTGEDYRYDVHQCHRGRLQVWCIFICAAVPFLPVLPVRATGTTRAHLCHRWELHAHRTCHHWELQVCFMSICVISICGFSKHYKYNAYATGIMLAYVWHQWKLQG